MYAEFTYLQAENYYMLFQRCQWDVDLSIASPGAPGRG